MIGEYGKGCGFNNAPISEFGCESINNNEVALNAANLFSLRMSSYRTEKKGIIKYIASLFRIDFLMKTGIMSHIMENIKIALSRAVVKILNPVVRLLLKYEVSHSEFSELAKRSYVEVAYKYFAIPGRKKTYSRVAVLTGLSRKEVVRLTKLEQDQPPVTKGPLNRAARVIGGWLHDPDFNDKDNNPLTLALRGDGATFEELVARYSGDITARAILDELVRVGAVEKVDKETVKLCHHSYIPEGSDPEKVDVMATCAADLLDSAVHNISSENKDDAYFQRQVAYSDIPESVIDEFKQLSHAKSLALLMEMNDWLAKKKKAVKPSEGENTGRVGVGIYYIQNNKNDEDEG